MIRYTLTCRDGHGFDSWFQNAEAFAALQAAGQLACPICGSSEIEKALMAPGLTRGRSSPAEGVADAALSLAPGVPRSELEAAIAALRRQIETSSDYVGLNFAAEARRMHEGGVPARAIHGEARPEEARRLIEDGIPVAPLPFLPARKVN